MKIGSIVTHKTNFLESKDYFENVSIKNDSDFITPLMVITEVLNSSDDEVDEFKRVKEFPKGKFQYKCIWFSKGNFKFEEKWFFEKELIEIAKPEEIDNNIETLKYGDKAIFKTNILETLKTKNSFSLRNQKETYTQNPVLNFSSPVFIFLGFTKTDKKEPEYDLKTLKQKRWYPSKLVKLKTFDSKNDKFSEFVIPLETIEIINQNIDRTILELVKIIDYNKKTNKNEKYIYLEISENNRVVIRPLKIQFGSGYYYLESKDLFSGEINTILIRNEIDLSREITIPNQFEKCFPVIKHNSKNIELNTVTDYLKDNVNNFKSSEKDETILIRIFYKNNLGKITQRFILLEKIFELSKVFEFSSDANTYYIQGFCLLRRDKRYFKDSNILKLEIIDDPELLNIAETIKLMSDN